MDRPATKYARSGEYYIAYQVIGEGPPVRAGVHSGEVELLEQGIEFIERGTHGLKGSLDRGLSSARSASRRA